MEDTRALINRWQSLQDRIRNACRRCGRDPSEVTLLPVSKNFPSSSILALQQEAGCHCFGESKVQEVRRKSGELGNDRPQWELVGHLQTNKAKFAVEFFDVVHSVDSMRLIEALDRQTEAWPAERVLRLYIQVNIAEEQQKYGVSPQEIKSLIERIQSGSRLALAGLMTMAPYSKEAENSRWVFRRLRELRDHLLAVGITTQPLPLSMGMSGDFEVAIEEGSNCVRIGTALFGERG